MPFRFPWEKTDEQRQRQRLETTHVTDQLEHVIDKLSETLDKAEAQARSELNGDYGGR